MIVKGKGELKFSDITSYWYRRGTIKPHYGYYNIKSTKDESINQYQSFLIKDALSYEYFFHYLLKKYKNGIGFYKEIKYKDNQFFEYALRFDSEMLKDRNYISLKNRLLKIIFRIKPDKVTKFKYLSFFEKYNYNIKNVYI